MTIEWLESAYFVREDGELKLKFLQSDDITSECLTAPHGWVQAAGRTSLFDSQKSGSAEYFIGNSRNGTSSKAIGGNRPNYSTGQGAVGMLLVKPVNGR